MNLDPVLLEILVCPDCKGSLTVDQDNDELICNGCGLIYPVRDDIPIMLVDEARQRDRSGDVPEAATEPAPDDDG
ncbi:MAG: Trm112 family protein [Nocardioidaceae bacterium]